MRRDQGGGRKGTRARARVTLPPKNGESAEGRHATRRSNETTANLRTAVEAHQQKHHVHKPQDQPKEHLKKPDEKDLA